MRVLTRPNVGGPTLQAATLYGEHRAMGVATLLVVGRSRHGEPELDLAALGVPEVAIDAVDARSHGFVRLPALGTRGGPVAMWAAERALTALARRFAPDVVHSHTSVAGWLGRRAARRARVPVVAHTFHGHVLRDYFAPWTSFALARVEQWLARRTDLLFAVSASCADELAALRVAARERFLLVPPAVPLPEFVPRAEARRALGLPSAAFAVACLGRLVPIKRVERFVAAVALVPGCRGQVHGDGPLAAALQAEAARAGGRVTLHRSSAAVRGLLSAFDALVLPSAREGCPLVAVEAFAAGVPVVGFDVPGVRDALGPWGGGMLVAESEGAAGLARALGHLRDDAALRAQVVATARAGLGRFAPAAVALVLATAYGEALRCRPGYAGAPRS